MWSRGRGVLVRDLGGWAGESKSARRAGLCQPQTRRPWPRGSPGLLGRLHGEALQLTELKAPFALPVLPEIFKNGSDVQSYIFIQHDWPTVPTPLCPPGSSGQAAAGPRVLKPKSSALAPDAWRRPGPWAPPVTQLHQR